MNTQRNKFPLKIILSYLVLGGLAVLVGLFLYSEYKKYTNTTQETTEGKKVIETGTLINLVYETDGLSRLALLSLDDEDFMNYQERADSLFNKIEEIKLLTESPIQKTQLDSVKQLLFKKHKNIEQLKILKLTNNKDSSLDDILREMKNLESSMGKLTLETFVENPSKFSKRERRLFQQTVDYLNQANSQEGIKVETIDSMLTASRYIVAEAKRENSRTQQSLQQKENELILSDLTISQQLRKIITAFDSEIAKNNTLLKTNREETIDKTRNILRIAGVIAGVLVLLFTYFILSDFFRAERFKKSLEKSKVYAEDLLKSREQLIATVSHDLKTPINTIVGYTGLMGNTALTLKQRQYIEQIDSGSKYVTKLVDDLLDLSKLEAGKLQLDKVPFSLENMVRQIANSIRDSHDQKPIELTMVFDETIKGSVFKSDPLRIQQIITNLVGNAFKFTEKGEIKISGKQLQEKNGIATVQLLVKDTGIGISEEKQELIFNEFTQADATTAQKFGGNGLGLTISRKLTELLGGSLTVESVLDKGSTFIVTMPLEKTEQQIVVASSEKLVLQESLSALVLDDDPAMTTLLKEVFEQAGIKTYAFNTYSELQKQGDMTFDFVLTDIQMPQMSGFEFLKNLKEGSIKRFNKQPVFAMTGSREHPASFYQAKGFTQMIAKPFAKDEILTMLQTVFPQKLSTLITKTVEKSISKTDCYDLSLLFSFLENEEKVHEVLAVFVTQTKLDLALLNGYVSNREFSEIADLTHRMTTMFRQIKAEKASELLAELENFEDTASDDRVLEKIFEELKNEIERILGHLKEEGLV